MKRLKRENGKVYEKCKEEVFFKENSFSMMNLHKKFPPLVILKTVHLIA